MALNVENATFFGPAFPEPFVRLELENELVRLHLLPKATGEEGRALQQSWEVYRKKLRDLVSQGGVVRVANQVFAPLVSRMGYERIEDSPEIQTREGMESGGQLMVAQDCSQLRIWAASLGEDLDAPSRRGRAYRFSHARIINRVLLACGERVGLLTNGLEFRMILSDPARYDSSISIPIDLHWKRCREVPDTYRLFVALASPEGVKAIPDLIEKARLQQTRVTRDLRSQARKAVEAFIQEVFSHSENREALIGYTDKERVARNLWHEGLIVVYRLLFILKLEASDDPARCFEFASSSLWRNSFSPSVALARHASDVLKKGSETGRFLEDGLRALFSMFAGGLQSTELQIKPLNGALFGPNSMPFLTGLRWGDRAVAHLLDRLLWTPAQRGSDSRKRVHYGSLDVEDLGRVYEALLELEPGIASEAMCRLRRQKLELVVPSAQGEKYRPAAPPIESAGEVPEEEPEEVFAEEEGESRSRAMKTKVEWIEEIPSGRFYLRVGLGRKASGSYYTPTSFVRFLVQETLGPLVAEKSPEENPLPGEILKLKVLDPAMGSGHFLVEACRFLGDRLYEACRLCDERAFAAERRAEGAKTEAERGEARKKAEEYLNRLKGLPDPNDEILAYLPSRAPEGSGTTGVSQKKAEALCRRLVSVHCLYGVDKNPLAVELAKLTLWMESHAEKLPLTFLDHRLIAGDSLTGPSISHLTSYPGSGEPLDDLFTRGLAEKFSASLALALEKIRSLEETIGVDLIEIEAKANIKAYLDQILSPYIVIAAAWAGGVMLGGDSCDDAGYAGLVKVIVETGTLPSGGFCAGKLANMVAKGLGVDKIPERTEDLLELVITGGLTPSLSYELTFPEVFFPEATIADRKGFDVILGNPPWERMLPADKEFFASYEFSILDAPTKRERLSIQKKLLANPDIASSYSEYIEGFRSAERSIDSLYKFQTVVIEGERTIGKQDIFRIFMEQNTKLIGPNGKIGIVVPSAFYANEGATGLRQLYLEKMKLKCCYSFENRRKIFEIHSSFKFALLVAEQGNPTDVFDCAFYLHDEEWLFSDQSKRDVLQYSIDFIRKTGGVFLCFVELRTKNDLTIANICFNNGKPFGKLCESHGISLGRELNITDDAYRLTPISRIVDHYDDPRNPITAERLLKSKYFVLHEGKTFHQYDDKWGEPPRYLVHQDAITDKPCWLSSLAYYRLVLRKISRSTDERTIVFSIIPPGCTTANSCHTEPIPSKATDPHRLFIAAIGNSFCFDYLARQQVSANVLLFILNRLPLPVLTEGREILVHSSLRLSCNHNGYSPFWKAQVGDVWREKGDRYVWPVLGDNDQRWTVRANIDAIVATAYGLSRDQYAYVLSTFSHRTYPKVPELCLSAFDELHESGLERFARKYDPYWDIPLNESPAEPVARILVPTEADTLPFEGGQPTPSQNQTRKRGRTKNG